MPPVSEMPQPVVKLPTTELTSAASSNQDARREIMLPSRSKTDSQRDGNDHSAAAAPPVSEMPQPTGGKPTLKPTSSSARELLAGSLRKDFFSQVVQTTMGAFSQFYDMHTFQRYRDNLLADCGNPTNPIEVMIIEQLAMAHFNATLLQCYGMDRKTNSVDDAAVYLAAAARLMGEFRRSALALQAFRAASVRLGEMVQASGNAPTLECENPSHQNCVDTESAASPRSDDDESPAIIPVRQRASG
jgi:hypothetical protein